MAGVSVETGHRGGRKQLDAEINMIPMIDLLMVTVSFLLITAVWSHAARMNGDAMVPGTPCPGADCSPVVEKRLHVTPLGTDKFQLAWKEGPTVLSTQEVPRESAGQLAQLAAAAKSEWMSQGLHKDDKDTRFDHVVVHTPNELPYHEFVAILDAVGAPKRTVHGQSARALEVSLATD